MVKKTKRGVFISLEHSDIVVSSPNGKQFKFTSEKKKEMFLKRLEQRKAQITNYCTKISLLIGQDIDLVDDWENEIYQKVYDEMLYK